MRVTRAGLLLGVLGAPVLPAVARAQRPSADAEVLAYLLRVQELEAGLYREALQQVPDLDPETRALVEQLRAQEVEHVDALRATLREAGGREPRRVGPAFGDGLRSTAAFLKLANTIEDTAVSAFNGAVPRLVSPELRAAMLSIAQVEARHAALVRLARDRPVAPVALDRPSNSQAVRSRIRGYEDR